MRVLVTGIGGYVGAAIADGLLDEGFEVVGVDRRPPLVDADRLSGFIKADLGRTGELSLLGGLSPGVDHLVHAAGGADASEVAHPDLIPDDEVVRHTLDDNLISAINVLRLTSTIFNQGASDRSLTLISSINAFRSFGLPAYSSAKAGLAGLMVSMAPVMARSGIRLNLLTLGTVRHPGVEHLHSASPRHFEDLAEAAPLSRLTSLAEVGSAAKFTISNRAIHGSEIILDSGQSS